MVWDAVYSDAALASLRALGPDERQEFRAVIDYILKIHSRMGG